MTRQKKVVYMYHTMNIQNFELTNEKENWYNETILRS